MRTGFAPSGNDDLLRVLVDLACGAYGIPDAPAILELVRQREAKMSTAIGHGLAVPHAKCDHVPEVRVAACTLPEGLDFRSPDKRPVRLAFLLVSPPSCAGLHVRALGAISRITPDLLERLVAAADPAGFISLLRGT